jgi:5-methylcytosine-specific restriction endonuclease McrA
MKPITDFVFINRALGKRQSWCRPCDAIYKRAWYAKNRDRHMEKARISNAKTLAANQTRAWTYLAAHPCVDCGEVDPIVLEFDHVRGDKRASISFMVLQRWCWETIQAEIEKCDVRCANCHRRKTARDQGYYERKRNPGIGEAVSPYVY